MSDLRFALRTLTRSHGFTVIAVVTLALGIGFSASSFSMANAFLLRNVPYPDNARLVRIFRTSPQSTRLSHAPGNLLDIRPAVTSFTGTAIYNLDAFALTEPGQPAEQVTGLCVSSEFFTILGVQPMLGRGFATGEDQPNAPKVAVLSYRVWVRRYASNPAVIGTPVRLNSEAYTVIGVLPASFDAPLVWGNCDYILPRTLIPEFRNQRTNAWMDCVARLKPGVTLAQAQTELNTIAARLAQDHPTENARDGLRVVDLYVSNMDSVSRMLLWLMTALSLTMLLIACANLASLQVARAIGRTREFAVRAALGGGRWQLMAPLLIESLVLSAAGGVLGLLVASWTNDIIGSNLRINNELGFHVPIDWRVLSFALFASVLSGLAFGLAPAWLAARSPAAEALKEGSRGSTGSASHHRIKRLLIITELALAVALVGVAGAFGFGARAFLHRDVGWKPDGLCVGYIALPYNRYTSDDQCRTFERNALDRLRAIPGVEHAVVSTCLPAYSLGPTVRIIAEHQPVPDRGQEPIAETGAISPDYFATLQIPLKEGAFFSPSLKPDDPPAAIVNEAFARRFWPGESAIGRRVRLSENQQWLQIVGVVADIRMAVRPDTPETLLHLYRPLVQSPGHYLALVVRGNTRPEAFGSAMRKAIAAIDGDLPVTRAGSLRAELDDNLRNLNLVVINLATSAGMGLLIASVGLFGVISQLTQQRTRDFGVRMALGAQAGDILRLVLGEGARLFVVAMIAGIPLFLVLNTVLGRAIPAMPLPGLWLLATTVAVLSATMLVATWLPARRATLINPVEALRAE